MKAQRLVSLDVFRGLVIIAMLIVNNIGDPPQVGYWWKHADWIAESQAQAYRAWWCTPSFTDFPLFRHCTLADFVMPWFMLIIGVAIPFSAAAKRTNWLRVLRRAFVLVVLGWAIDNSLVILSWSHSASAPEFVLGMNVLQLLGISYLVARLLYELPLLPRIAIAMLMLIAHWALLRFYPQGESPAGSLTEQHNAARYIYDHWWCFRPVRLAPHLSLSAVGMLSVVPASATMLLGTWIGDWLRRDDVSPARKVRAMVFAGLLGALGGFLWAFDLPFNKPRWTPAYLLYTSGVGAILLGGLYWLVDIRQSRWWIRPAVVFGANSIAAYWITIMAKIWLLNMPKVNGTTLASVIIQRLQGAFGNHAGSWAFTLGFVGFWLIVLDQAYRRRIFWKI